MEKEREVEKTACVLFFVCVWLAVCLCSFTPLALNTHHPLAFPPTQVAVGHDIHKVA